MPATKPPSCPTDTFEATFGLRIILETGSLAAERELIASWCGVRDGGGLGFASWEGGREGGCVCEKEGRWLGWGGDVVWGRDGVSEGLGGCDGELFVYYCMDLYRWLGELGRLVFGRCHMGRLCFERRRVVCSSP